MRRVVGGTALAAGVALAVSVPMGLAAAGRWDGPALDELDLGAAGAEAADGVWRAVVLFPDGREVPLGPEAQVVLELDTTTAALAGTAGCSPLLGSFTLTPDGDASFTVPSARSERCSAADQARDAALREVLQAVEWWHVDEGRLVLSHPGGFVALDPL